MVVTIREKLFFGINRFMNITSIKNDGNILSYQKIASGKNEKISAWGYQAGIAFRYPSITFAAQCFQKNFAWMGKSR
jgi:hypothetical protein